MVRKFIVYMCMYIGLRDLDDVRCTISCGCESLAAKFVREGAQRQANQSLQITFPQGSPHILHLLTPLSATTHARSDLISRTSNHYLSVHHGGLSLTGTRPAD